jgi:hypothetical protein
MAGDLRNAVIGKFPPVAQNIVGARAGTRRAMIADGGLRHGNLQLRPARKMMRKLIWTVRLFVENQFPQ